jgi:hypothetical protein
LHSACTALNNRCTDLWCQQDPLQSLFTAGCQVGTTEVHRHMEHLRHLNTYKQHGTTHTTHDLNVHGSRTHVCRNTHFVCRVLRTCVCVCVRDARVCVCVCFSPSLSLSLCMCVCACVSCVVPVARCPFLPSPGVGYPPLCPGTRGGGGSAPRRPTPRQALRTHPRPRHAYRSGTWRGSARNALHGRTHTHTHNPQACVFHTPHESAHTNEHAHTHAHAHAHT